MNRLALVAALILAAGATAGLSASPLDTISTYPYVQNFEGATGGWVSGTVAGGPNDWVLGTPAKVQLAGAHSGFKAYVTGVTGTYAAGQESYIQSPSFNMTALSGVVSLEFWQNFKTEPGFDGGALEMSVNGGTSWTRVDSVPGSGPTFNTMQSSGWYNIGTASGNIAPPHWGGTSTVFAGNTFGWTRSTTAISGIAGLPDVRFRWHFSADASTNLEGWAIDDVSVTALVPHDIGISSLGIPGYTGGPVPGDLVPLKSGSAPHHADSPGENDPPAFMAFAPVTINAAAKNFGGSVEPAYAVAWTLDGTPQADVVNTLPLPVAGTDTLDLTIPAPEVGIRNIRAWTVLPADANPLNDSAAFSFEVLDTTVVFYEGFNGTSFPPAGWSLANADGNIGPITNWYQGSFSSPQEGAGVVGDDYRTANGFLVDDYLITPNTGSPGEALVVDSLSFWLVANGAFPDSIEIRVSTSTTAPDSFTLLLDYIRPPVTWTKYTYALPPGASRYIAFRYLLYNGGPGGLNSDAVGLDNVRITRYTFSAFLAAPASVGFDSVVVGQASFDTITVTNTGNLGLTITSASVSGSAEFGVSPGGPVPVGPLESAVFIVSYSPAASGPASADLIFTHTGDNSPDTVALTGTGVQPAFTATPLFIVFDTVAVGFTRTDGVVVGNPGNYPLALASITSTNPGEFAVAPSSGTVPPGESLMVQVTFQPATAGPKSAFLLFTHDGPTSPDTVTLGGTGGEALFFTTLPPDSVINEDPLKPGRSAKPAKRFKGLKPNWSNLVAEVVTQGGFQPRSSESDSAGGCRLGISFMYLKDPVKNKWAVRKELVTVYHWMRLSKWDFRKGIGKSFTALQKTLLDKTGRHTGGASGFDSTIARGMPGRKPLKGQYTKLAPKKHNNRLLAELVALKINIAASALGKTPPGLGELVFNRAGHPYHGLPVTEISKRVDTIMTYWRNPSLGTDYFKFDSAYTALSLINRAFAGRLDTVRWERGGKDSATLVAAGKVNLAFVPYLTLPPGPFVPARIAPTSLQTEPEEDWEDEWEDDDGVPLATALYRNYPNPFNPSTMIAFRLAEPSEVTLRVYTMLGQEVAMPVTREELEEGNQEIEFNADGLSSGVYFYRLEVQGVDNPAARSALTGKMVLLK